MVSHARCNYIFQKCDVSKLNPKTIRERHTDDRGSYRHPPIGTELPPPFSAPRGQRSILAGVRAQTLPSNPVLLPHEGSDARARRHDQDIRQRKSRSSRLLDETMTKGNAKGAKSTRMEPHIWLSTFRSESLGRSRLSSGSRPPSGPEREDSESESNRVRSLSHSRDEDPSQENGNTATLLDE